MLRRALGVVVLSVLVMALCVPPALATIAPPKDINGDGHDDVAVLYDYGAGKVGAWAFDSYGSSPTSAIVVPHQWWISGYGWGTTAKITPLLADVTGDSKADAVMSYAYSATQMGMWVLPGSADGSFPRLWWKSSPTGWAPGRTKLTTSKSLSGTGPRTPVALYDYSNGKVALWVFNSHSGSSFVPAKIWESAPGTWSWAKCKIAGGDFNGDGKGDVAILYDYGNQTTGMWVFTSNGSTYSKVLAWKSAPRTWSWDRSKLLVGDVDGDGSDEPVITYDYGGSKTGFWVFQRSGSSMTPGYRAYSYQVDSFAATLSDVSHDGKADFVVFGPGPLGMGAGWYVLPSAGTTFDTSRLYTLWSVGPSVWSVAKSKPIP